MKSLILLFFCVLSIQAFSQENENEFLAVNVDGKEAFMSTKTGIVIFREHAKTNASAFVTPENGDTYYVETTIHSVKKGETLSSIAKTYKIDIDKLKRDNKLKNSKLSIGQKIKLNKNLSVESLKPIKSSGESRIVARLKPGQTPSEINMPPPTGLPTNKPIIAKNTLQEVTKLPIIKEKLKEKQENVRSLSVGKTKTDEVKEVIDNSSYYTVKKGDTLYSIAKKYNMTILELKKMNDLVLNNLSIGQKLKIK